MTSHTTDVGDFIRSRKGRQHADNCTKGYRRPKYCQIHHILCISSLTNASIKRGDLSYIKKCFKATTWNINQANNCIGLPLKKAYKYKPKEKGWDKLPCHQVDHPLYTKEVSAWLNDRVWKKLNKKKKDCKAKGKDIAKTLDGGSDKWRTFLTKRGKKHGGTRKCWIHRNDGGMEDKWYVPFSMDPSDSPPARRPIPQRVPALDKLFKHL